MPGSPRSDHCPHETPWRALALSKMGWAPFFVSLSTLNEPRQTTAKLKSRCSLANSHASPTHRLAIPPNSLHPSQPSSKSGTCAALSHSLTGSPSEYQQMGYFRERRVFRVPPFHRIGSARSRWRCPPSLVLCTYPPLCPSAIVPFNQANSSTYRPQLARTGHPDSPKLYLFFDDVPAWGPLVRLQITGVGVPCLFVFFQGTVETYFRTRPKAPGKAVSQHCVNKKSPVWRDTTPSARTRAILPLSFAFCPSNARPPTKDRKVRSLAQP